MRKFLSLFTLLLGLILIMGSVSVVANHSPPDSDDQITIISDIVQEVDQPADFKSVVETSPETTIKTVDQTSPDTEHSAVMLNKFIRPVDSRLLAYDLKPTKYVHGNGNLQNPFYPLE